MMEWLLQPVPGIPSSRFGIRRINGRIILDNNYNRVGRWFIRDDASLFILWSQYTYKRNQQ